MYCTYRKQQQIRKKPNILMASWNHWQKSRIRIRIRIEVFGSKDPDPYQNFTETAHCQTVLKNLLTWRSEVGQVEPPASWVHESPRRGQGLVPRLAQLLASEDGGVARGRGGGPQLSLHLFSNGRLLDKRANQNHVNSRTLSQQPIRIHETLCRHNGTNRGTENISTRA
jgi:hypothetical protein